MAQPLLEGAVDDRDSLIAGQRLQIRELTEELSKESGKNAHTDQGLRELRTVLQPLYNALKRVFGEMDGMGVSGSSVAEVNLAEGVSPRVKAAWDNWKTRLSPMAGRFIDALMIHGAMTNTQLRIAVGCRATSVTNSIYELNKAGLINKSGGKVSLKEL